MMVLNRTDVSINDANLVINDRFTLPSRGYYFQIRRPNADVETGIQFRTGGSVKWYVWNDNDGDANQPSLRKRASL